ncbi:TonB-dependent receptor [Cognatilysobacter terrigena]|uniref:TonB-dependent receptor n=1 Tax=Cognatilysobacter terrigena TaxID=2488749 RepID=UPI001414F5CB|nr:TonB-dependent receptor [Lysobacter terrigena]
MSKRQQMNRVFRRSALTVALGMCFTGPVLAQQAAGSVFGNAGAGATVVVDNPATGFHREVSASADGTFRIPGLQPGTYRVTTRDANGSAKVRDVVVNAGAGTSIDFAAPAGGTEAGSLDTVRVRGARAVNPIDVSSTESVTILTSEQIAKIPVPRDTTSVALLAPGTVRGDAAFGNLASFGGSSVAENQYYVNGFNITNSFRSLNFSQVPFEAIAEQQVKTGGYGAEFGRSLGGVVSQTTKRGTNDFHAGGNIFYTPSSLSAHPRDMYQRNGVLRSDNSQEETGGYNASAWASGALVKDRLFAYGLIQYNSKTEDLYNNEVVGGGTHEKAGWPTYLLKLDWNINDSNLLEFTSFTDKRTREIDSRLENGTVLGTNFIEQGGKNNILRYTGYFSDTFTLSALYGHGEFSRSQHLRTATGADVRYGGVLTQPATGCPIITDARPGYRQAATGKYGSTCNITGASIDRQDAGDTRDQFRVDADWQLGAHQLRFGLDIDNYESVAGTSYEGGRIWRYATVDPTPTAPNSGDEFDIVREQIVNQGSTVKVKQHAFYIQDSWNVTDNFIAQIGLRWDNFENLNGFGETYVKVKNQFGPRLGFSWDVNGDSTFKVYGNAGRYALPLTPSVAVRGASASLFTRQQFTFTGVDPVTGAPIGAVPRTNSTGQLQYVNGEFGVGKNPATIASNNLKPMYQDEFILGFQKAMNDHLNVGARGIYRNLKTAIDDNCDYAAILDAAGFVDGERNGQAAVLPGAGFPYCRMFNPGADAEFLTDFFNNGQLESTHVAGDVLSPKARRTYKALELFSDVTFQRFFMQASYTWSQSKGNTEGGVKSDIGQADTSVTQDFDYKELTVDTYGFLPNDRRHSLKVFGNYEFSDEWSMGANLLVQSGRPVNCLGVLRLANGSLHPYGASFMRCNNTPVPRGTAGRLPWTNTLDLNVAYRPSYVKGLQFKLDIFNLLNNQKVTSVNETGEDGSTGAPSEQYLTPTSFQAPRAVRFMVQYDF